MPAAGLSLPWGQPAILADTVGFVRDLPHELVEAFRSTLEETRDASLLLHVIDAADETCNRRIADVEEVLREIDAHEVQRLEVFNKIDAIGREPAIERDSHGRPARVWVSAATGEGMDRLLEAIAECVAGPQVHGWLRLTPDQGRVRARLFREGAVLGEEYESDGALLLEISLERVEWDRLVAAEGLDADDLDMAGDRVAGTG